MSLPHALHLEEESEKHWIQILQRTEDWNFDLFEVKQMTDVSLHQ